MINIPDAAVFKTKGEEFLASLHVFLKQLASFALYNHILKKEYLTKALFFFI